MHWKAHMHTYLSHEKHREGEPSSNISNIDHSVALQHVIDLVAHAINALAIVCINVTHEE